jgi:hypothetical protein
MIDLYSENPFRVLGLPSNVSGKDASKKSARLLRWIEIGETPQVDDLLPFFGLLNPDREQIKRAAKELEDPRIRLESELYWPSADFSGYESCRTCLKTGNYSEIVTRCEDAIANGLANRKNASNSDPQLDATLGCHYLAVFYHASALGASDGFVKQVSAKTPPADWDRAFKFWSLIIKDDRFWEYLRNRAYAFHDPRLEPSRVGQLRRGLPLEILRVNVTRGLQSLERGDQEEFRLNASVITRSPFGTNSQMALKELALPLQSRFEKAIGEIRPSLSETAVTQNSSTLKQSSTGQGYDGAVDQQKLTAYLYEIEQSINRKLLPIGKLVKATELKTTEVGKEILDSTAYVFRTISLALNNRGGMPDSALRLNKIAQEYAEGPDCKAKLAEDQQTLRFLSLQNDALELANASRYKESLMKLEEARQFASSDEDRQTIGKWIEIAKRNMALEGSKPVATAPSMGTINGIGTKLYGRRNYDSQTATYIATLYITFFYVPVIPIASYRVKDAGTNRYQFYGKVPLAGSAFIAPAVVALIILIMIVSANSESSRYSKGSSEVSSPASTTSPTSENSASGSSYPLGSGPNSGAVVSKSQLGEWIDRENSRLKAEESEVNQLIEKSDQDRVVLKQQFAALGPTPSDEDVDAYNRAKDRFNVNLANLKARAKQYDTDIDRYNSEVKIYNSMH